MHLEVAAGDAVGGGAQPLQRPGDPPRDERGQQEGDEQAEPVPTATRPATFVQALLMSASGFARTTAPTLVPIERDRGRHADEGAVFGSPAGWNWKLGLASGASVCQLNGGLTPA